MSKRRKYWTFGIGLGIVAAGTLVLLHLVVILVIVGLIVAYGWYSISRKASIQPEDKHNRLIHERQWAEFQMTGRIPPPHDDEDYLR